MIAIPIYYIISHWKDYNLFYLSDFDEDLGYQSPLHYCKQLYQEPSVHKIVSKFLTNFLG